MGLRWKKEGRGPLLWAFLPANNIACEASSGSASSASTPTRRCPAAAARATKPFTAYGKSSRLQMLA